MMTNGHQTITQGMGAQKNKLLTLKVEGTQCISDGMFEIGNACPMYIGWHTVYSEDAKIHPQYHVYNQFIILKHILNLLWFSSCVTWTWEVINFLVFSIVYPA